MGATSDRQFQIDDFCFTFEFSDIFLKDKKIIGVLSYINGKDAIHRRRRRIVHIQFRCSTKVNLLHLFEISIAGSDIKHLADKDFFQFTILPKSHEKGPFDRHRRSRLSVWNATFRWVESLMRRGIFSFFQIHRLTLLEIPLEIV